MASASPGLTPVALSPSKDEKRTIEGGESNESEQEVAAAFTTKHVVSGEALRLALLSPGRPGDAALSESGDDGTPPPPPWVDDPTLRPPDLAGRSHSVTSAGELSLPPDLAPPPEPQERRAGGATSIFRDIAAAVFGPPSPPSLPARCTFTLDVVCEIGAEQIGIGAKDLPGGAIVVTQLNRESPLVHGPAERAGLRRGDVILGVNYTPAQGTKHVGKLLKAALAEAAFVKLQVTRGAFPPSRRAGAGSLSPPPQAADCAAATRLLSEGAALCGFPPSGVSSAAVLSPAERLRFISLVLQLMAWDEGMVGYASGPLPREADALVLRAKGLREAVSVSVLHVRQSKRRRLGRCASQAAAAAAGGGGGVRLSYHLRVEDVAAGREWVVRRRDRHFRVLRCSLLAAFPSLEELPFPRQLMYPPPAELSRNGSGGGSTSSSSSTGSLSSVSTSVSPALPAAAAAASVETLELFLRSCFSVLTVYAPINARCGEALRTLQAFLEVPKVVDVFSPPPPPDQKRAELLVFCFLERRARSQAALLKETLLADFRQAKAQQPSAMEMLTDLSERVQQLAQFVASQHGTALLETLEWNDEAQPAADLKRATARRAIRRQSELAILLPVRRQYCEAVAELLSERSCQIERAMAHLRSAPSSVFGLPAALGDAAAAAAAAAATSSDPEKPHCSLGNGHCWSGSSAGGTASAAAAAAAAATWSAAVRAVWQAAVLPVPSDQVDALREAARLVTALHRALSAVAVPTQSPPRHRTRSNGSVAIANSPTLMASPKVIRTSAPSPLVAPAACSGRGCADGKEGAAAAEKPSSAGVPFWEGGSDSEDSDDAASCASGSVATAACSPERPPAPPPPRLQPREASGDRSPRREASAVSAVSAAAVAAAAAAAVAPAGGYISDVTSFLERHWRRGTAVFDAAAAASTDGSSGGGGGWQNGDRGGLGSSSGVDADNVVLGEGDRDDASVASRASDGSNGNSGLAARHELEMWAVSADDFLPLFTMVVVHAAPPRLMELQAMLSRLMDPEEALGEAGYFVATLEACIHMVGSAAASIAAAPAVSAAAKTKEAPEPTADYTKKILVFKSVSQEA